MRQVRKIMADEVGSIEAAAAPMACNSPNTVTNTNVDISPRKEEQCEEELLQGLLTDDYCHVCEAVLLFESQRLSHYEGKKHWQKLRLYLQAKRAQGNTDHQTGLQGPHPLTTATMCNGDRFCALCKMVFSSAVVARSHYRGKVHAKNLRKHGHQLPEADPPTSRERQKSDHEGGVTEQPQVPVPSPSMEVDLKDPNRYCALCTATFNNPQMALQHYQGRKHKRNQARQDLLRTLGEDEPPAKCLMCQMCSLGFDSVEMYQAHMQGNKHQTREKRVVALCKSQQKVYESFADELADYIEVQRARGVAPRDCQRPPQADRQVEEDSLEEAEVPQVNNDLLPSFPPSSASPHWSHPGSSLVNRYHPPYYSSTGGPAYGWDSSSAPSERRHLDTLPFNSQQKGRKSCKKRSSCFSSSSFSSCSYSSSYSSSSSSGTSDSEEGEPRKKRKRSSRPMRKRGLNLDEEVRKRKDQMNMREKRRRTFGAVESEDIKRMSRKKPRRTRGLEKTYQEKDTDDEKLRDSKMSADKETNGELQDLEQDETSRAKRKRRMKEKVDTRTEEEKLWDESIIGC